ncbi:MAG: hypothetical protein WAL32_15810 [Terriglobales bacterium]
MNRMRKAVAVVGLLVVGAVAQQSPAAPAASGSNSAAASKLATVRGCLTGQRVNYIVVENNSGSVYVLKGVGNKLDSYLRQEVEVKGKILPGTIKTGVRPEKAGSNPADTVHGVDGVPLRVANVQTDIRTISKKCKAADRE